MNNSTTAQDWSPLPIYLVYIVQGLFIASGNLLIVCAIARYEALRNNKEYLFMMSLSLADCINMMGFLFVGIYRIRLLANGTHNSVMIAWDCLTQIHSVFWSLGMKLSGMMLLVVSCDRLLAVIFPLTYVGWTVTYARRFVGSVYVFNLLNVIYFYTSAYGKQVLVPAACVIVSAVRASTPFAYGIYFNLSLPLYPVLSVIIYGFVMLLLQKRFNSTVFSAEHPNQQYELKRQRKVTVTLSVSALCTLFLFVIPMSLGWGLLYNGYFGLGVIFGAMSNFNPLCNVFIYPLRHKEIKRAVVAMLSGKRMPTDLKLWKSQEAVQPGIELRSQARLSVSRNPPLGVTEMERRARTPHPHYVPRSATTRGGGDMRLNRQENFDEDSQIA